MKYYRTIIFLIASITVFGCAKMATKYQPSGATGGYTENKHGEGSYSIHFQGNAVIKIETVEKYALYRGAELTVQDGYNYFIACVTTYEEEGYPVSTSSGWEITPIYSVAEAWIHCFKENPAPEVVKKYEKTCHPVALSSRQSNVNNYQQVYNARELMKTLDPEIQR